MRNTGDNIISKDALDFVKKNKRLIIDKFANKTEFIPSNSPASIFLAGAPGVGKTEFAKSFNDALFNFGFGSFVHIDADQIREMLPQYNGENSDVVQQATNKGVEILFDQIQKQRQSVIVDSTFSSYDVARKNIGRALSRKRSITIYYIYQKPLLAWDFTKKRYEVEGRVVNKDFFVESLIKSGENVNRIKNEFHSKVKLSLLIKNYENKRQHYYFNIKGIDQYLDLDYNRDQLTKDLT